MPKKERDLDNETKKCSNKDCDTEGNIAEFFGFREYRFEIYAQSQCKKCRGKKRKPDESFDQAQFDKATKKLQEIGLLQPDCERMGRHSYGITTKYGQMESRCIYCDELMPENKPEPAEVKEPVIKLKENRPKPPAEPEVEVKLKNTWISGDKGTLRIQYKETFPKDTNNDKRAAKFMIQKLMKKLPNARLTPTAQKILEG